MKTHSLTPLHQAGEQTDRPEFYDQVEHGKLVMGPETVLKRL